MSLPPIHEAAADGDVEKLTQLLNSIEEKSNSNKSKEDLLKEKLNSRDFADMTPLHFAARWGKIEVRDSFAPSFSRPFILVFFFL